MSEEQNRETLPVGDPAIYNTPGPGNRRALIGVISAVMAIAALGIFGTVGVVIGARTPLLVAHVGNASLVGGSVVVSGVARNTGTGPAQNLVISAALDIGGGLNATANLGDLAAGASVPYSVTIPLGGVSASNGYKFKSVPRWDAASLDVTDNTYDFSTSGADDIVTERGNIKNTGKGNAPNVSILWTISSDKACKSVIGTTTKKVGDVAAGAAVPFQLAVDLGANSPNTVWYCYDLRYDEGSVAAEQESSKRSGGTLTVAGTLHNEGPVPAAAVGLSLALFDSNGKRLAVSTTSIGGLVAKGKTAFTVTIDLGDVSPDDIHSARATLAWQQTRFFVVRENKTLTEAATLPGT